MPLYDFKCPACEMSIESFSSYADRDTPGIEKCPGCETDMKRQFSAPAVIENPMRVGRGPKHSSVFKERMAEIKKTNRGSTMGNY